LHIVPFFLSSSATVHSCCLSCNKPLKDQQLLVYALNHKENAHGDVLPEFSSLCLNALCLRESAGVKGSHISHFNNMVVVCDPKIVACNIPKIEGVQFLFVHEAEKVALFSSVFALCNHSWQASTSQHRNIAQSNPKAVSLTTSGSRQRLSGQRRRPCCVA